VNQHELALMLTDGQQCEQITHGANSAARVARVRFSSSRRSANSASTAAASRSSLPLIRKRRSGPLNGGGLTAREFAGEMG
jgi:hypothetical protein